MCEELVTQVYRVLDQRRWTEVPRHLIDDVKQEVALAIWRQSRKNTISNLHAYASQVIGRVASRMMKREQRRKKVIESLLSSPPPHLYEDDKTGEVIETSRDQANHVSGRLHHLPCHEQQLLRLYKIEQLTCHQVGNLLGMSPAAVRKKSGRLLRTLRVQWQPLAS